MSRRARWVGASLLISVWLAPGCAPEIGDSCSTALDCAASATRLCDLTQPGGYCTLEGCEADTCPDEAVCVQFGRRIEGQALDRLSRTFCMFKCGSRSDCRDDENYDCFSARTFGASNEAQIVGNAGQKFCAPVAPTDQRMSLPDGGS